MKRKQRNRLQVSTEKEANMQMQAIQEETKKFMNFLYYQDIDDFFTGLNLPINDRINAFRLLLLFGFLYDKDKFIFRTEREDLPENQMMTMLKGIIPADKLVFNYVPKVIEEEIEEDKSVVVAL